MHQGRGGSGARSVVTVVKLAAVVTALAGALVLAACERRAAAASRFEVTYYYIPHCMSCEKVRDGIVGMDHDSGGRIKLTLIGYDTPEGIAGAEKYGFVTHGVVLKDAAGRVLWQEKDHDVSAPAIRAAAKLALAGRPIAASELAALAPAP